jgi:hypothetical protein
MTLVGDGSHEESVAASLARFAELEPLARLRALQNVRQAVADVELDAVVAARNDGRTWSQIGQALGITRQAAQERFGEHDPRPRRGRADDEG